MKSNKGFGGGIIQKANLVNVNKSTEKDILFHRGENRIESRREKYFSGFMLILHFNKINFPGKHNKNYILQLTHFPQIYSY